MSQAHPARAARGVTLVELMVAVAMASVIIAGAVTLFLGQQRAFQAGAGDRSIQDAARVALEEVAGNLRRAGYGVDQAVTFDFGQVTLLRLENSPPTGTLAPGEPLGAWVAALAPADCTTPVLCRDRVAFSDASDSASASDELVFRYRNPSYGPHPLTSVSTGQLAIQGGLTNLAAGQELLVICYGAEPRDWAYVTVDAPGTTNVNLRGTGSSRAFPQQNGLLTEACFSRTGADAPRVFRVERLRYFVQSFADPSGVPRPYLMVSRGQGGAAEPVAPDVEDLQVAYIFPFIEGRTPTGTASPNLAARMVGDVSSAQLANAANSIDLTATTTASTSTFPTQAEARLLVSDPTTGTLANRTPSNIRAVRLSLVVRSPNPDSAVNTVLPASLNRPQLTPPANTLRFRRFLVETTVFLNNMTTVHSYAPYYRTISSAPGSLAGGG